MTESLSQVDKWRRLAKTAKNAFEDLMTCCGEGGAKGRPMDLFHPDDWKRMKSWKNEIESAEKALVDRVKAQRRKPVQE